MGIYTEAVQKLYVAYFNRPADFEGLAFWEGVVTRANGNTAAVSAAFAGSQEYKDTYAGKSPYQIVNAIYNNLFGRDAEVAGLTFWGDNLRAGKFSIDQAVTIIANAAAGQDLVAYNNKVAAATAFSASLDTSSEIIGYSGTAANNAAKQWLSGVTTNESLTAALQPAALAATVTQVVQTGTQAGGQITVLTKGLDNVQGTSGSDTIIAAIDSGVGGNAELNTLSSVDIINGGTGIDFLKIAHASGDVTLGNLSNVEIVQIDSAAATGVTVDSTNVTGVTELAIVKSAGVVTATAGGSTDISLTTKENNTAGSTLAHTINGGKNVNVTATEMGTAGGTNADTITVGNLTAAKGNVVVNVVGKAYDAAAANMAMGAINVKGGSTITVNQAATVNSTAVGADDTAGTVTQGAITATTDAATTAVSVKQTATVAAKNGVAAEVGGVNETATVKFNALQTGDSIALNGLTFTAKANMTAAEVAAAFSSLVKNTLPVSGDTQSSGVYTKGAYTGVFDTTKWTSGAATGDTVVFSAVDTATNVTDLNDATLFTFTKATGNTSTAPTFTTVQGVAVTAGAISGGVMGVQAGVVSIDATTASALKTVTVDGYTATGSGMTGTGSTMLDTVNLMHGGNFAVQAAAETLALNLTDIGKAATSTLAAVEGVLDINATATKTVNVTSTGANFASLDLAGATSANALNVSGTGLLTATGSDLGTVKAIKVSGTAGLNLGTTTRTTVTSVDTTGTTGTTTIKMNGSASYAGGAGKDLVTIADANVAIAKSIDLGAGDDTLDISNAGTIALPTVDLKGGDGRDTLKMTAANAVALSANGNFGAKFDGFEVLSIDKASVSGTVNLANLDNINYVISANSSGSTATKATFTATLTGGLTASDTVAFNGTTFTATGALTASQLALQLAGLSYTDWTVKSVAANVITFEAINAGVQAVPANGAFVFTDADTSGNTLTVANSGTAGVGAGAAAALTLSNFVNGGTLELTGSGSGAIVSVKDAATGTADVLNIVAKATGLGTVTANNVETVNIEAAAASDLTVAGNTSLATINVTGSKALGLTLAATDTNVTAVNASTATGALTLNLSAFNGSAITVTGGAGNDVLTASAGATGHADILVGGAGADILVAGSNGARLTGGAGNDMFVLSTGTKEANTYSIVTDFSAGDLLQLKAAGNVNVTVFAKLTASLNESTSVFSNFVDAAIAQAGAGEAVWFTFGGNSYVVIDNGDASVTTFENGVDSIIQLAGVNTLDNVSINTTYGTIGLI